MASLSEPGVRKQASPPSGLPEAGMPATDGPSSGRSLRQAAELVLRRSPMQPLFRRRASKRLAVLAYHGIDDAERFEQHLDYAVTTMRPVSVDEVEGAIHDRRPLPSRAVLFTFDDGERSILDVGMPLMSARGVPGVAFVVAGLIGTRTPFWFNEVEELLRLGGVTSLVAEQRSPQSLVEALKRVSNDRRLAALAELRETARRGRPDAEQLTAEDLRRLESGGIRIGSHTLNHPCLVHCEDDEIRRELGGSDRVIAGAVGARSRLIAYPNGDWNERVVRVAQELGYRLGFTYDHRLADPARCHPLLVRRLRVESTTSLDRFAATVSGLALGLDRAWGWLLRRRGAMRAKPTESPSKQEGERIDSGRLCR